MFGLPHEAPPNQVPSRNHKRFSRLKFFPERLLVQRARAPADRYGPGASFETMPSKPMVQVSRNIASPCSPSTCSLNGSPPVRRVVGYLGQGGATAATRMAEAGPCWPAAESGVGARS